MTLVAAWIRQRKERDELFVASDSRLSFGARWDCCPKIFPLAREDCVLTICGDTSLAYPILLQLSKSISNYSKSASRELDVTELGPHFLKILERMRSEIHDLPAGGIGNVTADFKILFAGYSLKTKQFKAWSLFYNEDLGKFRYRPLTFHKRRTDVSKPFFFIGKHSVKATRELYKFLSRKGVLDTGPLDMEPLEILCNFITDKQYSNISGPPQIVKVYPHARTLPINVLWPVEKPSYIAHFGRPLLSYESSQFACYDLRSMKLLSPQRATEEI